MKNNSSEISKIWFEKAENDLKTAHLLLKESGFPDTICYFSHQAVEKFLKGYLISKNVSPKRIHNLIVLSGEAEKYLPELKNCASEIASLNDYYIPSKYPVYPPVEYSKKDAEKALDDAETVTLAIKKNISF